MKILFILLFFVNSLHAQISGTINYSLKINNSFSRYPINYLMIFDNNKSLEIPLKLGSNPSEILETSSDKEIQKINTISGLKTPFIYKNFNTKDLTFSESIFRDQYLVKDTFNNFKWIILKEHKKVLDYDCTKATTFFRGRNYEAWFTESISIPNGPWKFCGLPGLILKVNDTENIYNFELTGINIKGELKADDIKIPKPYEKDDLISYSEFIKIFIEKEKELDAKSRVVNTTDNSTSTMRVILPKRMEKY